MSANEGAVIVVCTIDPHRVALLAGHVEQIGEGADGEVEGAADLAALLGVPAPGGPRRALRLATGPRRWLLIGDRVAVRRVPPEAFTGFPAWLAGARELQPFAGLVAIEGTFALELDPARLTSEVA